MALENFIIKNLSIGLLSLFAFDLFISGLALLICVFSKSNKKTISINWCLTMIMCFSIILGPIGFAISPGDYAYAIDNLNFLIVERN
ncbi:hypothetical protein [Spiroplasma floricola]|uniref:Uncharacterized protein n=1 Tax=Spiroplasma floricola 23-6 TaxID=1336749 RepID=A0A2K8SDE7_9MOLU|nr:hypothetical protein [Spiroplasma floricola]AUB31248.1 hypothetical protein SFLOR_v1c01870 [Spiroplasma floricola 23-6]